MIREFKIGKFTFMIVAENIAKDQHGYKNFDLLSVKFKRGEYILHLQVKVFFFVYLNFIYNYRNPCAT